PSPPTAPSRRTPSLPGDISPKRGEGVHSPSPLAGPESPDPRRRLGAQAHHLAARHLPPHEIRTPTHRDFVGTPGLRSSVTQLRLRSFRCSAPNHDLAHLDTNSLAANRWIRAGVCP